MKRLLLGFALIAFFCGPVVAQPLTVGFITGAGGLGDNDFSDITYSGIRMAQQKYPFRLIIEEPGPSGQISEMKAQALVTQCDIIVFLGSQHSALAGKYAGLYPSKQFINFDDALEEKPNLISIVFKQHEGSYLAGVLAGLMTKTKKVGFIGGTDFDVIHDFRVGFRQGVVHVANDVLIEEQFIAEHHDASGFNNPQKAYDMAENMYQHGVDIIYSVAGISGNGVIHAAKSNNKFVIGVDTDQDHMAKGHVLTSMMKRVDLAVNAELSQLCEGHYTPGVKYYGLKERGVGLSPMTYTRILIPESVLNQISIAEKQILSGDITVNHYSVHPKTH